MSVRFKINQEVQNSREKILWHFGVGVSRLDIFVLPFICPSFLPVRLVAKLKPNTANFGEETLAGMPIYCRANTDSHTPIHTYGHLKLVRPNLHGLGEEPGACRYPCKHRKNMQTLYRKAIVI